jgi:hypothetical protein
MQIKNPNKKVKIIKKGKIKIKIKDCNELEKEFENVEEVIDKREPKYQKLLKCLEDKNRKIINDKLDDYSDDYKNLYPIFEDNDFNYKIANKQEFNDYKYDERDSSYYDKDNIEELANKECQNTNFELSPHQMFVRNFLSFQTPYNGLLLYHEVGTGKTCSAISVTEEMRDYMIQISNTKKIIVVASPAVQENFKLQLFDERKLKNINGVWNIKSCTGNKFLREINPLNTRGMERKKVIKKIKNIITKYYYFMGYLQFSNYLDKIMNKTVSKGDKKAVIKRKQIKALKKEFTQRMLVIDEVHNLRIVDKMAEKESTENIFKLVSSTDDLKLLLLSATPMFNSYEEIIWIINLLNLNDNRFSIKKEEIFDKNGQFLKNKDGKEIGKELFIQKITGYISFVKGNDPLTFPFIVYPKEAENEKSYFKQIEDGIRYPRRQINNLPILEGEEIQTLDLTLTVIGEYQKKGYDYVLKKLKKEKNLKDEMSGMNYTFLEPLLQSLNIVYPHELLDNDKEEEEKEDKVDDDIEDSYRNFYGTRGLSRVMLYDRRSKNNFRYKDNTIEKYGRIFSQKNIGKYSSKIKSICDSVIASEGIIFIFSQYIEGGCVPVALALEEMGITRYGKNNSLFEEPPVEQVDAITLNKVPQEGKKFKPAKYAMILGDKSLTPDIKSEIKAVTSSDNTNGEVVKVVIVSKAGSEGLDFKNIRETHILDPWYNLHRQEQIIGRSARNLSHCNLDFNKRNVSVFLYGTKLDNDVEAADLYLYRLSENKAKKISAVNHILKENAVDCLLNNKGKNYSQGKINNKVEQILSNGSKIELQVGEKDGSKECDFVECEYKCNSQTQEIDEKTIDKSSYNYNFIQLNIDNIVNKIKYLYKEGYIYDKSSIIQNIQKNRKYSLEQINSALDLLTSSNTEYVVDMLGRLGRLKNIDNFYFYQPIELDGAITTYEQRQPIDYKREKLVRIVPEIGFKNVGNNQSPENIYKKLQEYYDNLTSEGKYLGTEDSEDWSKTAAWSIYNLNKWNNIDKKLLQKLAMFHLIDTLSENEKRILLTYDSQKKDEEKKDEEKKDEEKKDIDRFIKEYFDKFMLKEKSGKLGIVIANFDKHKNKLPYTLLSKNEDGEWVEDKQAIITYLARLLVDKFKIMDISKINDFIGFMTMFKGQMIIFKSKTLKLSEKGRKNIGERCDRGQTKNSIVKLINNLLIKTEDDDEYIKRMGKDQDKDNLLKKARIPKYKLKKSTIEEINGIKYDKSDQEDDNGKTIKINTFQLCIELELMLRYYDYTGKQNKRWFFNTVDFLVNNIEDMVK